MNIGFFTTHMMMTLSRGTQRKNSCFEQIKTSIQLVPYIKNENKSIQLVPYIKNENKSIQVVPKNENKPIHVVPKSESENKPIQVVRKSESENKPIQLGLCCLNTILRSQKPSVFASRKMIMRTVIRDGIPVLKELILQNLRDILTMMQWNEDNGIKVFRLSSQMFPHKTNPKIEDYTYDFCKPLLLQIGKLSKILKQRLTFHPGQFNVVGTPHEEAFKHTLEDLKYHADVLDLMGMNKNSVIVVHAGGYYNDKEKTIDRWCKNFSRLADNVQKRLVIENCEKSFSVLDCLIVSSKIGIPVVFDTHHFECYKKLHPDEQFQPAEYYIPLILDTWKRRGIKPKFHVSEQGSGRCGHHSDFIQDIPNYLLEIPDIYNIDIDIMIEAKKKEQAIMNLYKKYPYLNCQELP